MDRLELPFSEAQAFVLVLRTTIFRVLQKDQDEINPIGKTSRLALPASSESSGYL